MIEIDRMELEDVGGNPVKLAQAILTQIPDIALPIPIREIATALDIYDIREENSTRFEGALIAPDDKSEGAIIVRRDRTEERKRYTIGHELGHYLNPWHFSDDPAGFRCTSKYLAAEKSDENNRLMKMEVEANEFSAELLMPSNEIQSFFKRRSGADLQHVIDLASLFQVSKEAVARRYVEQNTGEITAVIFSKNGVIRYVKKHQDFPWLNVGHGSPIPEGSNSQKDKPSVGLVTDWSEVGADIWIDSKPNQTVFEQTLTQSNGFHMTLLTRDIEEAHDYDEDDEYDLEESWTPTLGRRR